MSSTSSSSDPPSIESATQLMTLNLPTASTIKKYKMQIQLDQPLDSESYSSNGISHSYRPGDSVNGDVVVIPPDHITPEESIKFNEVAISLECKVINNVGGKTKTLFTMSDDVFDVSDAFESEMRFPFHFELPTQLFDNICPYNIDLHKQVPPSFASPRLCSLVFSGIENAGVKPTECAQYAFYKDLPLNRFCVVYYITAAIRQKTHRKLDTHVILKRVLDISVQNYFEPVPTNLRRSSLDIAHHYSMTDISSDDELLQVQRTSLKKDNKQIGALSSSVGIPTPISISAQDEKASAQISLKFESKDPSILPHLKYNAQLTQFVIQSSCCIQPVANPVIKNLSVETISDTRRVTIRGKTLITNVIESEWRPDYSNDGPVIKDINVEIPHLAQQKLEPTFHSCTLQNVYVLDVDIIHENLCESSDSTNEEQKSSLKNNLLDKIGIRAKNNNNNLSIHKSIQQNGGLSIKIPITLLA